MDVSEPFQDTLWIGTSKEYGWSVSVEYEGNHAYCQYCGLLGYSIRLCRKKRQAQGKNVVNENEDKQVNVKENHSRVKAQRVAKSSNNDISRAPHSSGDNIPQADYGSNT